MKIPSFVRLSLGLSPFLALGFVTYLHGTEVSDHQAKLNGGYYLLHHLCDEESQVSMLNMIKHTPTDIALFTNKVSDTAKESIRNLDQFQDRDPAIRFDKNPLPSIEKDIRESISDSKQDQLLFGTSDAAFVQALLVSQIEASNYALNISKVLSEQESDPARIQSLKHMQVKWEAVRDEAYRLLKNS